MKKANQFGFSAVGVLIIIFVLAIIGGTGYFVWKHSQKSDNKTTPTQSSQQSASNSEQSLALTSWATSGTYSGTTKLTAKIDGSLATLSSDELEAAAPHECGYALTRYKATDHVTSESGDDLGVASTYFAGSGSSQKFVYVGGYYYLHISPQTSCRDASGSSTPSTTLDSLQSAVFDEASQVLQSLKSK